ncbi:hypothetical protein ACWY4P_51310 [Streptomyces sp. LZ34]
MERATDEHEMVRCDIAFHDAVFAALKLFAAHRRLAVDVVSGTAGRLVDSATFAGQSRFCDAIPLR